MRCKGEGCLTTRKGKLTKAKCWSIWGICGKCAVKKYPTQYRKKVIASFKEVHKYESLAKPGINGYQGMDEYKKFAEKKEELKVGII